MTTQKNNIGIIGTGRLGLCFALLAQENKYSLFCSDINSDYVSNLQNKKIKTHEPEVSKYLKNSKNIKFFKNNYEVFSKCEYVYTFVPTPSNKNGSYDIKFVQKVIKDLINFQYNSKKFKSKTLIIGCTVNPGDTSNFKKELSKYNVKVLYNPEFIAQGSIISDLRKADMVLIGKSNDISKKEVNFIKNIYKKIQVNKPFFNELSYSSAEVVKLSINCFLTTKISYANFIGQILINLGSEAEVNLALKAIGDDTRIGNKYLKFGYGFGGPCLPRDNRALGSISKKMGINNNLGLVVDSFNKDHVKYIKDYLFKKNHKNLPFFFKSIVYKIGTDIITESHQLKVFLEICKLKTLIFLKEKEIVIRQLEANYKISEFKNLKIIKSNKELPKKYFEVSI